MKRYRLINLVASIAIVFTLIFAPISTIGDTQAAGTVVDSIRITELNRVLGLSLTSLRKMKPEQINQLFIANADTLGVQIYQVTTGQDGLRSAVLVAGNDVFKALDYGTTSTSSNSTIVLDAYPATDSSEVSESSIASPEVLTETLTLDAYPAPAIPSRDPTPQPDPPLSPEYSLNMPIILRNNNIQDRVANNLTKAKAYIDLQYADNGVFGVVKEYPGCPVSIRSQTSPNSRHGMRFVGDYYQEFYNAVGVVTSFAVGYDYELSDVSFEAGLNFNYGEPIVYCDQAYFPDGTTRYVITKFGWPSTDVNAPQDLYLGDIKVFTNVKNTPIGTTFQYQTGVNGRLASNRFTIRHVTNMSRYFYLANTDPWKVSMLTSTVNTYGFGNTPDIYAPMFEQGTEAADDYFFTNDAYHDCDLVNDGMDSTIIHGYGPYRYPYESKVCLLTRSAYIALSRHDYLVPALQAIHILNKYNDPNYVYPDPDGIGTVSPTAIAMRLEAVWSDGGIPVLGKDPAYISGIRTNAFLALETLLGYKYGDAISKSYADLTAEIITQVQWGSPPFPPNSGETLVEGVLLRPNQTGGQLLMWKHGNSYDYSLPPKSFMTDIIDMFSMPNETEMLLISNSETTLSYWAALRLYQKYKFGN